MTSGVSAALPVDAEGGTWIGLNEHGLAFAILNRNFTALKYEKARSRGSAIPLLLPAHDISDVLGRLELGKVKGVLPFTLVASSAHECRVLEIIFDGEELSRRDHPWQRLHWFSSGLSDIEATAHRRKAVEAFIRESDVDTVDWVRRLHRSHLAGDAFSMCVHRDLVGSVSYTEIDVEGGEGRMSYFLGPPCAGHDATTVRLPLRMAHQTRARN
jgi:hypothetical protein